MQTKGVKSTKTVAPKLKARDIRRKKALKNMMANGGNVSAAMVDAGYSPNYAHTPANFLNTKGAADLLEQFFPDAELHAVTKGLMQASELESYTFPTAKGKDKKPLTNEEIKYIVEQMAGCTLIYIRDSFYPEGRIAFFRAPAHKARKDGVEIAYKLKGAFKAEAPNPNDRNPLAKMSDEELAAVIKEAKKVLTKK